MTGITGAGDMNGTISRHAVFNAEHTRRYLLTRQWHGGPVMAWVMLNPSTAGAETDDPTIVRCVRRARQFGCFGGIAVVNLFSLRATDPRELYAAAHPASDEDDSYIAETCAAARVVVAAWGTRGSHLGRDAEVVRLLTGIGVRLYCLGITSAGRPRHPLYMCATAPLLPWECPALPDGGVS